MELKENSTFFLYRRGKIEHINALFDNGEIYLNTVDFIRTCGQNEDRSDLHDGIALRNFLGEATLKICEVGQDINKFGKLLNASNLVAVADSTETGNIYCLSGIYSEHLLGDRSDIEFNTRSFGESVILIHNPRKFINLVLEALKRRGYGNVRYGRVTYYPQDYSGHIGFFKKHERFRHQHEYRFFIPNKANERVRLRIGSLKEIAIVAETAFLRLTYTDGKQQVITMA